MSISGSTFTGNSTVGTAPGGAVSSFTSGQLTITNSLITGSSAVGDGGGVFAAGSGTTTITNTTVSNNTANSDNDTNGEGGGLYFRSDAGAVTVSNSTVNGNRALGNTTTAGNGGGIDVSSVMNMTNSTVSGNTAGRNGGGIRATGGTVNITSSTIVNNTAGNGGGVNRAFTGGSNPINFRNTIVANNTAATAPDISGSIVSQGYNLIENTTGATITGDTTGNITGVDPNLSPLRNNGGLTQTHALLLGSPAIDAGTNCVVDLSCPSNNPPAALTTDQRGAGFPRAKDSNFDGTATVDIGAFEGVVFDMTPAADTWVQGADAFRNTNFGTSPELQVKRTLNPGNGRGRRGFLRFNTSGVTGAVPSAKLRIFARLTLPDIAPTVMIVQKVTDTTWNELTVTWNNQPLVESSNALSQITVAGTTARYYEFDLTSFIQAERAVGRTAVAFRLINLQPTGNTGAFFTSVNSKEAATNRPLLVIEQ